MKLRGIDEREEEGEVKERRLYISILAGGILLLGLLLRWLEIGGRLEHILAGLALFIAWVPIGYEAAKLLRFNPFNTQLLMSIAAIGATAIGFFEEGAAVLVLYNFAEVIEDRTVEKVRGIARRMASLLPRRALRKEGGKLVEVDVEELKVGEVIVVKPNWRIPVDGRIVSGRSSVDQSTITGESFPIEKGPGDRVLSGTLNLDGSFEMVVEKPFKDSTISRITKLVVEAKERKTRIERFIDRFSRYYTPLIIALAASMAFLPPLTLGQPLTTWVYRALIVLVVACPSALVISTPVTTLIGLTRAMWSSILVKGGFYLEEMSRIKAVAFDKTGTLTLGRLQVTRVVDLDGRGEDAVLQMAAMAEARSSHPIADAIVSAAKERGLEVDGELQTVELQGKGVKAHFNGSTIMVGRPSYLLEEGIRIEGDALKMAEAGSEGIVGVALNGRMVGFIAMTDKPRPEAKEALESLKAQGYRVIMLTGDNELVARSMAQQLGIEEYYAALLPEDKVRVARELREKYGALAMVGDGVNDAPVLAEANVGIAMGSAGNDVAIEVADVALMGSDLRMVPYLLRLGKKVTRKLRANIGLALGLKILIIILAALGLIPLWLGVLGDDGVTLVIVAYALTLLRLKP